MYILLEEISSIQVNQFNQSHIHFYDISTCLYRYPDSHLTSKDLHYSLEKNSHPIHVLPVDTNNLSARIKACITLPLSIDS
jgi:hypothetical protein